MYSWLICISTWISDTLILTFFQLLNSQHILTQNVLPLVFTISVSDTNTYQNIQAKSLEVMFIPLLTHNPYWTHFNSPISFVSKLCLPCIHPILTIFTDNNLAYYLLSNYYNNLHTFNFVLLFILHTVVRVISTM